MTDLATLLATTPASQTEAPPQDLLARIVASTRGRPAVLDLEVESGGE